MKQWLDILRSADATDKIKELSCDSASEFLGKEMRDALARLGPPDQGGVVLHVKPPGRAARQDIADLDSKMGISRVLWRISVRSDRRETSRGIPTSRKRWLS